MWTALLLAVALWQAPCDTRGCASLRRYVGEVDIGALSALRETAPTSTMAPSSTRQDLRKPYAEPLVAHLISTVGLPSAVTAGFRHASDCNVSRDWDAGRLVSGRAEFPELALGHTDEAFGFAVASVFEFVDQDGDREFNPAVDTILHERRFADPQEWLRGRSVGSGASRGLLMESADSVVSWTASVDDADAYRKLSWELQVRNWTFHGIDGQPVRLALRAHVVLRGGARSLAAPSYEVPTRLRLARHGVLEWPVVAVGANETTIKIGASPLAAAWHDFAAELRFSAARTIFDGRETHVRTLYLAFDADRPSYLQWRPQLYLFADVERPEDAELVSGLALAGMLLGSLAILVGGVCFRQRRLSRRRGRGRPVSGSPVLAPHAPLLT